jgi:hypothetical protein
VALALAERLINGSITLATVTSERVVLRHSHEWLPLKRGPVTSVTSLSITGTAQTGSDDDGWEVERFGLRRKWPYTWPAGELILVTYTVGWEVASRPNEIAEAITLLETWVDTKPEVALASVKIGDESATYRASNTAEAPPVVDTLLARWKRVDVG